MEVNWKFQIPNPIKLMTGIFNKINIWHIILLDAIIRFFCMTIPSDGGMIFDEVHYVKATESMLQGVAANAEHPPLTKIIGLIFMKVFGDYWFAWRFPIVIFALAGTYVFYLLAKAFLKDEKMALIAASFTCFDIIWFIHGNIYMLEMPALTFSLAFAYYFVKKKYFISAVMIGLGFLCNEKALYVLLGMFFYQLMTKFHWKDLKASLPKNLLIKNTGIFLLICILVGGGGLFISDMIWKPSSSTSANVVANVIVINGANVTTTTTSLSTILSYKYITDPFSHVWFMFTYFTGLNGAIPQVTSTWRPPWSWILPIGENWNNPPVYLETTVSNGVSSYPIVYYRAESTFPIWWMTIPLVILAFINFKEDISKFILAWIGGNYLPWLLWEPFKMNMPFNHYFLFTIPCLCVGIPWFWSKVLPKYKYEAMVIHLTITIIFFFWFFPIGLVRVF
jgi:4-amino-4-deoxy-L-arabinose transferase-like glycosyltransferase